MIIRQATKEQLEAAMLSASNAYSGNIRFKNGPDPVNQKGTAHRLTLTVNRSAAPGGRRSNTGRKIAAACWHVHREFMKALYLTAPNAVISSALATYRGEEDFENEFEATGDRNIGSAFQPQSMRTACECEENSDYRSMQADQKAYEDAQRRFAGVENALATYDPLEEAKRTMAELQAKVDSLQATVDNETEHGPYYEG